MTNEISKRLMCILMRSGVELWKEEDRIKDLNFEGVKFINIDGEKINTADISGIFSATTMEETNRRKNGEWKCKYNNWHNRNERCEHRGIDGWVDVKGVLCKVRNDGGVFSVLVGDKLYENVPPEKIIWKN